jgi:hypothetical protein
MLEILTPQEKARVLDELKYASFTGNLQYVSEENKTAALDRGFTLVPEFFRTQKAKNCKKGISCGNACIAATKTCRKTLDATAKKTKETLKKKISNKKPIPEPELTSTTTGYAGIDRADFRQVLALGKEILDKAVPKDEKAREALLAEVIAEEEAAKEALAEYDKKKGKKKKAAFEFDVDFDRLELNDRLWNAQQRRSNYLDEVAYENVLKELKARVASRSSETPEELVNKIRIVDSKKDDPFSPDESDVKTVRGHLNDIYALTGEIATLETVEFQEKRPHADSKNNLIALQKADERGAIFHEVAHHLEFDDEATLKAASDWRNSRFNTPITFPTEIMPEKLSVITNNNGYDDDELAYRDKFTNAYVGKVYGTKLSQYYNDGSIKEVFLDGDGARLFSTEVTSMGVQSLASFKDFNELKRVDREHLELVIGILAARGQKPPK